MKMRKKPLNNVPLSMQVSNIFYFFYFLFRIHLIRIVHFLLQSKAVSDMSNFFTFWHCFEVEIQHGSLSQ